MRTIKLFCIPYAGCSASIYSKWKRKLPQDIELIPLEPAGRGRRCDEPLYNNLNEAVDDLYWEAAKVLDRSDEYILFGHSMGSLLAFELYYKLMEEGFREPLHLYVSGARLPIWNGASSTMTSRWNSFKNTLWTMMYNRLRYSRMMNSFIFFFRSLDPISK